MNGETFLNSLLKHCCKRAETYCPGNFSSFGFEWARLFLRALGNIFLYVFISGGYMIIADAT